MSVFLTLRSAYCTRSLFSCTSVCVISRHKLSVSIRMCAAPYVQYPEGYNEDSRCAVALTTRSQLLLLVICSCNGVFPKCQSWLLPRTDPRCHREQQLHSSDHRANQYFIPFVIDRDSLICCRIMHMYPYMVLIVQVSGKRG